jgi:hypothetical protein
MTNVTNGKPRSWNTDIILKMTRKLHVPNYRSGRRPASKVAVIEGECKSSRILPRSARMHVPSRTGKESSAT